MQGLQGGVGPFRPVCNVALSRYRRYYLDKAIKALAYPVQPRTRRCPASTATASLLVLANPDQTVSSSLHLRELLIGLER